MSVYEIAPFAGNYPDRFHILSYVTSFWREAALDTIGLQVYKTSILAGARWPMPSTGVLDKLTDHGVIGVDEELSRLVSDIGSTVLTPSARWAIFIFSHFIVVAFEW